MIVDRQVNAVLEVAIAALSAPPETDPVQAVLPALRRSVGADAAGYYEHDPYGWSTTVHISPVEIWGKLPFTRAPTAFATRLHPGINHLLTTRAVAPFTVTDIVPERVWRYSELGTLMRPEWGRNEQLLIPVPNAEAGDCQKVWVLGRVDSAFTANDRQLCERLQRICTVISRRRAASLRTSPHPRFGLTRREQSIVTMVARGERAEKIAERLGISRRTVDKHLEHAYRKLDVHNRRDVAHRLEG